MGNRVLVGVLAAIDALVAAAVGLSVVLAPLTLLWVFGFGDGAVWTALWPAAARVWELGHLVPVAVTLPAEYAVTAGVPTDASAFTLSLAPLALAGFTAVFAARSGVRAASAGAAWTGAATGAAVFAVVAAAVLATSHNPVASVTPWQAVALPAAVFAVPAVLGGAVGVWRAGDDGPVDRLRVRIGPGWDAAAGAAARGAAIVVAGLTGVGALVVTALIVARGGEVIALFQAGHTDALGATVVTLGQLGYLPTLIVWAVAFVAGPGFALGAGTVVSPGAVQLPLVPGIPVLGILPPATSPWLLLLGLVPVALGVLAGRRARRDLGPEVVPRIAVAVAVALLAGATAGLVAAAASGAMGPGALSGVGPDAVAVAVALGAEVVVGAALALLIPGRASASVELEEEPEQSDLELLFARGAGRSAPIG